jgi:GNAT superfamily N-acetyltransferase
MPYYRRLSIIDRVRITQHLLDLSPGDRRQRFYVPMTDASIIAYVARMDWAKQIVIGAITDGAIIGIAEIIRVGDGAEIAVSVNDTYQRQGIGRALVARGQRAATSLGAAGVILHFEPENPRIPRIVRALGGTVDTAAQEAALAAPEAGPFAWWCDLLDSATALATGRSETVMNETKLAVSDFFDRMTNGRIGLTSVEATP